MLVLCDQNANAGNSCRLTSALHPFFGRNDECHFANASRSRRRRPRCALFVVAGRIQGAKQSSKLAATSDSDEGPVGLNSMGSSQSVPTDAVHQAETSTKRAATSISAEVQAVSDRSDPHHSVPSDAVSNPRDVIQPIDKTSKSSGSKSVLCFLATSSVFPADDVLQRAHLLWRYFVQ